MRKVERLATAQPEPGGTKIEMFSCLQAPINSMGYFPKKSHHFKSSNYTRVVYLGSSPTTDGYGDLFACYPTYGGVNIWRGKLNDGLW